jgi:hypothetical protein
LTAPGTPPASTAPPTALGNRQGVAGTSEYVICHIYMRHRFCWG